MTSIINSKSFNLIRRVSKDFTLLIAGFSVSDTLIFLCRIPALRMVANARIALKFISSLTLGRNRITISRFAMNQRTNVSIAIRPLMLSILTKLSEKWSTSLIGTEGAFKIPLSLTYIIRSQERWMTNVISLGRISLGRNLITFVLTLATYKTLSSTDSQLLDALDITTLNDMDYVST